MVKIIVLDSAKADFLDVLAHYRRHHTPAKVAEFKEAVKALFADMKLFPLAGAAVPEAADLGFIVRQRLVEQVRVIYECKDEVIYVRMFLSTKSDFMDHLTRRLLRP
jgi:plasmid stabilization system protein ParE